MPLNCEASPASDCFYILLHSCLLVLALGRYFLSESISSPTFTIDFLPELDNITGFQLSNLTVGTRETTTRKEIDTCRQTRSNACILCIDSATMQRKVCGRLLLSTLGPQPVGCADQLDMTVPPLQSLRGTDWRCTDQNEICWTKRKKQIEWKQKKSHPTLPSPPTPLRPLFPHTPSRQSSNFFSKTRYRIIESRCAALPLCPLEATASRHELEGNIESAFERGTNSHTEMWNPVEDASRENRSVVC
jgi:hypothetical protein